MCKHCCSPEGAISFWNFSMLDCGNSSLTKLLYSVAFQKNLTLLRCVFCKVTTSISTFCCRAQLILILSEMYNSARKFSLFQRKVSFWDEVSASCLVASHFWRGEDHKQSPFLSLLSSWYYSVYCSAKKVPLNIYIVCSYLMYNKICIYILF